MRCVAHILNLIVSDGLKEINPTIKKIRDVIRFIEHSPARLRRFRECCVAKNTESKGLLCLDIPTNWNSTYLMLNVALKLVKAFERFEIEDPHFSSDLLDGVPTYFDWENAKNMVEILVVFYDLTVKISGCLYVTSNLFYHDLLGVSSLLRECMVCKDVGIKSMAIKMRVKYDKYWGEPKKMNQLICVYIVMDPRYKSGQKYAIVGEFGERFCGEVFQGVMDTLKELFEANKVIHQPRGEGREAFQDHDQVNFVNPKFPIPSLTPHRGTSLDSHSLASSHPSPATPLLCVALALSSH